MAALHAVAAWPQARVMLCWPGREWSHRPHHTSRATTGLTSNSGPTAPLSHTSVYHTGARRPSHTHHYIIREYADYLHRLKRALFQTLAVSGPSRSAGLVVAADHHSIKAHRPSFCFYHTKYAENACLVAAHC